MQTAIAAFPGFAVVAFLVLILERVHAMWLCRKALRAGRGFRWKGGLRPFVEIEAPYILADSAEAPGRAKAA
jgi:hypothetical protein